MEKKVLLKDVATLLNGRAYKQDELLDSGKYPVLRVGNFFSNRGWFYSDLELEDDKYCDNGDLLFAWSASFGPKIWDGGKVIYHYHIWKILTNPQIDKKFFYYYLENTADRIKESGHGIAMIHTTKGEMEQMELLLPDMEQQLRIASTLDKVSELINLRKQQLAKLDDLVKSRFIELFGDVGTDEKSWGMNKLSYCCQINPKKAQDTRLISGLNVSFIPMPAVSEKGDIDTTEIKTYDEVKTGFTYFCDNDVLFAKITPCMENGKGAVAKGLCNGIGFGSTEFHVLRPYADICNPQWLYILTSFEKFRKDAEANMTGSAGQKRVPAVFLENFKVSIPPIELQNQFAAFVEQTDKSKLEIQQSLEKLETLKKSLMQKYFG